MLWSATLPHCLCHRLHHRLVGTRLLSPKFGRFGRQMKKPSIPPYALPVSRLVPHWLGDAPPPLSPILASLNLGHMRFPPTSATGMGLPICLWGSGCRASSRDTIPRDTDATGTDATTQMLAFQWWERRGAQQFGLHAADAVHAAHAPLPHTMPRIESGFVVSPCFSLISPATMLRKIWALSPL